jgi:hypothetical protein
MSPDCASFQTTKLASSRPFGEHQPASPRPIGAERQHVVRELALKEGRGIGAARTDQPQMLESGDAVAGSRVHARNYHEP